MNLNCNVISTFYCPIEISFDAQIYKKANDCHKYLFLNLQKKTVSFFDGEIR